MPNPYLGEIRMFAGNFAPQNWVFCDGQLLSIAQNQALYSLLLTTYGGDGEQTFALPNLQGRIPIDQGQGPGLSNRALGAQGGAETVTLTLPLIPAHTHPLAGSTNTGVVPNPTNQVLGTVPVPGVQLFRPGLPNLAMASNIIGPNGGSQPHDNRMPYLAVNYILCMNGVFPPPS